MPTNLKTLPDTLVDRLALCHAGITEIETSVAGLSLLPLNYKDALPYASNTIVSIDPVLAVNRPDWFDASINLQTVVFIAPLNVQLEASGVAEFDSQATDIIGAVIDYHYANPRFATSTLAGLSGIYDSVNITATKRADILARNTPFAGIIFNFQFSYKDYKS